MTRRKKLQIAAACSAATLVVGLAVNVYYSPSVALQTDVSSVRLTPLDGGAALTVADLRGKWVVLDFWGST